MHDNTYTLLIHNRPIYRPGWSIKAEQKPDIHCACCNESPDMKGKIMTITIQMANT